MTPIFPATLPNRTHQLSAFTRTLRNIDGQSIPDARNVVIENTSRLDGSEVGRDLCNINAKQYARMFSNHNRLEP